ncbi:DUF3168 domain-containing protein [Diaphorobacter sp. HDW4B]|uniref:tail completion protein gp17 n=1 Tax=Diaphorobacter sp. HDW4B TaxID=2714925 RepID=UPI0014081E4C|nr:DUF3168 domain-containing protein [Diaphorobacter sp. HDW4B]QIL71668.1 DUF3168 domain-containing protein [Diaphorobacter sp. HDW4B]
MSAPNAPKVIMALLKVDAALVALLPVECMFFGDIPQTASFPALACTNISDVDEHAISGNVMLQTARVQVTVAAKDYPTKERLIGAVRGACDNKRGLIAGITVRNVRSDGIGPDLDNKDAGIFGRTIDFLVTSRPAN